MPPTGASIHPPHSPSKDRIVPIGDQPTSQYPDLSSHIGRADFTGSQPPNHQSQGFTPSKGADKQFPGSPQNGQYPNLRVQGGGDFSLFGGAPSSAPHTADQGHDTASEGAAPSFLQGPNFYPQPNHGAHPTGKALACIRLSCILCYTILAIPKQLWHRFCRMQHLFHVKACL